MRLVRHMAPGYSPKARALRQSVRSQFDAGRRETDPVKIDNLKSNAVRALSNYMLYQSARKDVQLQQAMKDQIANVKKEGKKENNVAPVVEE